MAKEAKERDDPMVRLLTAPNDMVARMWADILEQEEIRSMTRPATFSAAYNVGYSFNLQFEIWVLTSQAEKAREILTPLVEDD